MTRIKRVGHETVLDQSHLHKPNAPVINPDQVPLEEKNQPPRQVQSPKARNPSHSLDQDPLVGGVGDPAPNQKIGRRVRIRISVGHGPSQETNVGPDPSLEISVGPVPSLEISVGLDPSHEISVGHDPNLKRGAGHGLGKNGDPVRVIKEDPDLVISEDLDHEINAGPDQNRGTNITKANGVTVKVDHVPETAGAVLALEISINGGNPAPLQEVAQEAPRKKVSILGSPAPNLNHQKVIAVIPEKVEVQVLRKKRIKIRRKGRLLIRPVNGEKVMTTVRVPQVALCHKIAPPLQKFLLLAIVVSRRGGKVDPNLTPENVVLQQRIVLVLENPPPGGPDPLRKKRKRRKSQKRVNTNSVRLMSV